MTTKQKDEDNPSAEEFAERMNPTRAKYKEILAKAAAGENHEEESQETEGAVDEASAEEVKELEEKLLRVMAENQNIRKRNEKEMEDTRKYAVTGFARDMIGVLENLHRAEDSIPEDKLQDNALLKNISDGVKLVKSELMGVLRKHGVERIDPMGQKFDHNLHQAMMEIPDEENEPGTVVQVMQAGYVLKDRLLRPAMVGLAKKPEETGEPDALPAQEKGAEDNSTAEEEPAKNQ